MNRVRKLSTIFHPTAWVVLFLAGTISTAAAQSETSAVSGELTAYPAESVISVDGQLTEDAWANAQPATGFLQFSPNEGAPPSQETEVRVIYGSSNLYIGGRFYDESPDAIVAALGRRDDKNRADWFFVAIDSYFDRKTAYVFGLNAGGVQFDGLRSGEVFGPGRGVDESWDAIWESDARVTDFGWVAEMRIPYSMLRFSNVENQRWGIHFTREIPRLGEEVHWPLVRRSEQSNMVSHFAVLGGLSGIEPRRNVQVRPYTLSRLQTFEHAVTPGELNQKTDLDIGADLKIGLTSGLTLDATVNPDFGQVEVDPAVLNLTAFETFFQEKRPFFLEGSQIFEFSLDRRADLIYTRRIGGHAPIIGAAKLSGRTTSGTSVGLLGATTGDNFGPERHYGIARVSQEIGDYSSAGAVLTGFYGPDDDFRRRSVTGGADWDIRFRNNAYDISGFGVFSHRPTEGPGGDPTGFAGQFEGGRRQGNITFNGGVTFFSDDFNANDIGLIRRNNYINVGGFGRYRLNEGNSFGPFQRGSLGMFFGQEWSYDRFLNTGFRFRLFSDWTLKSFQEIQARAGGDRIFGGFDLYETRGLGVWYAPAQYELSLEYGTDARRSWVIQPQIEITRFEDGGTTYGTGFRSDWNVSSMVGLSAEVSFKMDENFVAWSSNEQFLFHDDQWLIGHPDRPRGSTNPDHFIAFDGSEVLGDLLGPGDSRRAAIFGRRDTRELDFTLRSNLTFTPTLSVQFYGQLFVARGRFDDFQLLKDPDTLAPFDSFPLRDEFTFNNFTANTVIRWEFRPGSRLYVVWTQARNNRFSLNPLDPTGDSPFGEPFTAQFEQAFDIFPENVFLVKIDYTFLR